MSKTTIEMLVTLAIIFVLGMVIIPVGNTISSGDIDRSESFCEPFMGIDYYNTLFANTVYCNDGRYAKISEIKYAEERQ